MAPQESTTFRGSATKFADFYRMSPGDPTGNPSFLQEDCLTSTGSLLTPTGSLLTPIGSPLTPTGSYAVKRRVHGGMDGREVMDQEHRDETKMKCGKLANRWKGRNKDESRKMEQ